jgi:hypothetical protein
VGEEVEKDASKEGTTSADIIVQAFTPTSRNLHTVTARDPKPTGEAG